MQRTGTATSEYKLSFLSPYFFLRDAVLAPLSAGFQALLADVEVSALVTGHNASVHPLYFTA
jgi:hypothetical protein